MGLFYDMNWLTTSENIAILTDKQDAQVLLLM